MARTRILAAVSSPWASENLIEPLADLATRLEAEVLIAHVARLKSEDASELDAADRADRTLGILAAGLEERGVAVDRVMLFARWTARAILQTAHERECDMIVVGITAMSRWRRWFATDVAGTLSRSSDLPVLLYPPGWSGQGEA